MSDSAGSVFFFFTMKITGQPHTVETHVNSVFTGKFVVIFVKPPPLTSNKPKGSPVLHQTSLINVFERPLVRLMFFFVFVFVFGFFCVSFLLLFCFVLFFLCFFFFFFFFFFNLKPFYIGLHRQVSWFEISTGISNGKSSVRKPQIRGRVLKSKLKIEKCDLELQVGSWELKLAGMDALWTDRKAWKRRLQCLAVYPYIILNINGMQYFVLFDDRM